MVPPALLTLAQAGSPTTTPAPGTGPGELVEYWPPAVRAGWFILGFVVVLLVGWYLVGPVVSGVVRQRNRNNPTVQEAISRYFRLFVGVVAVFVAAGVAGYGGFLTDSALVIAAATLAIGVAGQVVLGSIISGLVLVMDPEFNIGDYIEWEAGEGTIRSITLRVTRLQTPKGEIVTVPNTVLTSQAVTNPYSRERYRVDHRVDLAHEDDLDDALGHLEAVAAELDPVVSAPPPRAIVEELGDDAVVIRVSYWIDGPTPADVFAVRSAYARAIMSRLESAGFTISPAPGRDLQGRIEVAESG
ncbi:MAG: mechanosensitive ion channel family protein [Halanaeroarchaeum sp.]